MSREKFHRRVAALAGLAVVVIGWLFARLFQLDACTAPPGLGPIIALELARTPAQAAAILSGDACLAAQHGAGWLDALGFIPAYALFLGFAALAAGGRTARVAVAAVIVAALCDQIEGYELFRIIGAKAADAAPFAVLVPVVRAKFALLGLAVLLIGGRIVQRRGWGMIPGALIVLGGAVTLVSVADDARAAIMLKGATLSWLILLVFAAVHAVAPRRAGR